MRRTSILNNNLIEKPGSYGVFFCQEKTSDLLYNCIHYGLKRTDVFLFMELCFRSAHDLSVAAPLSVVAVAMGYKEKTASDALLRLRAADLIRRKSGHTYMINPCYCIKSFKSKFIIHAAFNELEADPRSRKNSVRIKRMQMQSDPFAYFGFDKNAIQG